MSKIYILDEYTINQIAAGEIVERPVSVVKELVENSLDAGAKNVFVDIWDGGLKTVKVTDDGCGMSREDIQLAFQRHATSKIKCASDLTGITTLGFRGEALPSIAAVSKVSVTTRAQGSITGTAADFEGGSLVGIATAGCPEGTSVTVKELFYNTPVRKKAMKSPASEGAHCVELVSRLSVARPDVSFQVTVNGRRVFYSPGSGSLADAVNAVYGSDQTREMIFFEDEKEGMRIQGMAGKPSLSRSTKNHITVIVNGRLAKCPSISSAVEDAYKTFLPAGRRPVAVISLNIAPGLTDVNVHPSKSEIKILEEHKVAAFVASTVKNALKAKEIITSSIDAGRAVISGSTQTVLDIGRNIDDEFISMPNITSEKDYGDASTAAEQTAEYPAERNRMPFLQAIARFPPVFILAGGEEGLYIVDQHAAHERILYEEYLLSNGVANCQYLLVPVALELDYREASLLVERVMWFTDLGFIIEHFGGNTFLLRGVPQNFPCGQEKALILDMLDYFKEKGNSCTDPVDFQHRLASSMACRNAVKAGEILSADSMNTLLMRLGKTENPYTCPHGRPTIFLLSYSDLASMFKR